MASTPRDFVTRAWAVLARGDDPRNPPMASTPRDFVTRAWAVLAFA